MAGKENKTRRRLSTFHNASVAASSGEEKTPSTGKRQRRLSTFRNDSSTGPTPRLSRPPLHDASQSRLSISGPTPSPRDGTNPEKLSREEISQLYSETIKLSMDNKINAKNTWTLPLIDYMGMLVQGNEEQESDINNTPTTAGRLSTETTNFQLAGVTLDAGVRIYCSRVDSVHSNAFKVLGGLSRTKGGDDDDGIENNEEEDGLDAAGKKKNRRPRGGATLVGNLSSVTVRKLETDLAVDPLFQKMSEAFDDGSAAGMLANRLFVAPSGYILFDSAEPATMNATENDKCDQTYDTAENEATFNTPNQLCPEFMSYVAAKDIPVEKEENKAATSTVGTGAETDRDSSIPPLEQDVHFEYEDGDANIGNEGGGFAAPIPDMGMYDDAFDNDPGADPDDFEMAPYDPVTRNSTATVMPGGGVDLVEAGVELCHDSEYTFFDAASLSAWAGPQHWTFRKKTRKSRAVGADTDNNGKTTTKRPRSKMAMLLDYSEDAPAIDFKKQFQRARHKTSNLISTDGLSEKKTTLPEDLHYSTRDLTTLSLLPSMRVAIGGRIQGNMQPNTPLADGGAGPWYDYDNDMDADNFVADGGDLGDDDSNIGINMDGDADDVSAVTDMLGAGLNLVAAPDRVEKLDIGYATVAKKVDVRKLKSGLWSHLCGGAEEGEADGVEPEAAEESQNPDCDIRKGDVSQNLSEIVHEMPNYVPENALADVTFPYVFICLLHLANEKTLSIETTDDALRDITIKRDARLQKLKKK